MHFEDVLLHVEGAHSLRAVIALNDHIRHETACVLLSPPIVTILMGRLKVFKVICSA